MKKPDRFTKMVDKMQHDCTSGLCIDRFVFPNDVIRLLRREDARKRRLIKACRQCAKYGPYSYKQIYQDACDDILAAWEKP